MVAGVVAQRRERLVMSIPARSATMPLACSMTTRLLSAWWSCSFTSLGVAGGVVVEDGDGGDVGEGLGRGDVGLRPAPLGRCGRG